MKVNFSFFMYYLVALACLIELALFIGILFAEYVAVYNEHSSHGIKIILKAISAKTVRPRDPDALNIERMNRNTPLRSFNSGAAISFRGSHTTPRRKTYSNGSLKVAGSWRSLQNSLSCRKTKREVSSGVSQTFSRSPFVSLSRLASSSESSVMLTWRTCTRTRTCSTPSLSPRSIAPTRSSMGGS